VDLDAMAPTPMVDGKGSHGGYCGTAVKPIALNMVAEIARTQETQQLDISGIGGIENWRDAAEFIALGANAVQVCTAAMLYGFRIVEDMIDGMSGWMDAQGHRQVADFTGAAVRNVVDWNELNMGRCFIACEDTSHQAIKIVELENGHRRFDVIDDECVGCNLCHHVCPVPGCIDMEAVDTDRPYLAWPDHPSNPMRGAGKDAGQDAG
jgi:dihydropyrimidine dehydrogenase (NAD+) subunit PreA